MFRRRPPTRTRCHRGRVGGGHLRRVREAEIGHDRPRATHAWFHGRHQHHICRLEIAVHDAGGVHGAEPGGHLLNQRTRLGGGEGAVLPDPAGERVAVEQLHREERDGLPRRCPMLIDIEDATDVGMGDAAGERDLALRPARWRVVGGLELRWRRRGPRLRRPRPFRRGRAAAGFGNGRPPDRRRQTPWDAPAGDQSSHVAVLRADPVAAAHVGPERRRNVTVPSFC